MANTMQNARVDEPTGRLDLEVPGVQLSLTGTEEDITRRFVDFVNAELEASIDRCDHIPRCYAKEDPKCDSLLLDFEKVWCKLDNPHCVQAMKLLLMWMYRGHKQVVSFELTTENGVFSFAGIPPTS